LFSVQQDCPNGELTPAKFVDMYKMFFPSGNAEEFCDHVFRTFDMDKNGFIDFKVSESLVFQTLFDGWEKAGVFPIRRVFPIFFRPGKTAFSHTPK
jgi:hypothetical protein